MHYDAILFNASPYSDRKVRGLGAHKIANTLRKYLDWNVRVFDFTQHFTVKEFKYIVDKCVSKDTKFVGFSSMWFETSIPGQDEFANEGAIEWKSYREKIGIFTGSEIDEDLGIESDLPMATMFYVSGGFFDKVASYIRSKGQVKILIGGPNATLFRENPDVDSIFIGFSETEILDWATKPSYDNKIINHDTRAWNGSNGYKFTHDYVSFTDTDLITANEPIPVELSRGCRFACKFCSFPFIGDKNMSTYILDKQTIDRYFRENYEKHGTTRYVFVDDTFNDSMEKVKHYHDVITNLPFDIHFWAYIRADVFNKNPDMPRYLMEMGLREAFFGIETLTRETGKIIGKGLDPERLKQVLFDAREVWGEQVITTGSFIVGLPKEKLSDIMKNWMPFLKDERVPINRPVVHALQMIPRRFSTQYPDMHFSHFDKHYEEYGYSFPNENNNETDPEVFEWIKDEGPDGINSKTEAQEVADWINQDLHRESKWIDVTSAALDLPDFDDFKSLINMPYMDQKKLLETGTPRPRIIHKELLYKNYIKPTLESL